MPPRADDPRRNVLRVPLTDDERADVEAWADAAGVSMAEVVRAALWPTRPAPLREPEQVAASR